MSNIRTEQTVAKYLVPGKYVVRVLLVFLISLKMLKDDAKRFLVSSRKNPFNPLIKYSCHRSCGEQANGKNAKERLRARKFPRTMKRKRNAVNFLTFFVEQSI